MSAYAQSQCVNESSAASIILAQKIRQAEIKLGVEVTVIAGGLALTAMDCAAEKFLGTLDSIVELISNLPENRENTQLLNQVSRLVRNANSTFQTNRRTHESNVEVLKDKLLTELK